MTFRVLTMPDQSGAKSVSTPDHSTRQVLTACVVEALGRLGLTQKEIAALMGVRPEQWTRQREGRDGHRIPVQRLDNLPDRFLDELLVALARARGVGLAKPDAHLKAISEAMRAMSVAVEAMAQVGQPELPFERRRAPRGA